MAFALLDVCVAPFLKVMHDVVVQKLPVRMILDRAGLVGNDGPTHHGSFDLTYLGTLPHIVIMAPSDEVELMNMIQVRSLLNMYNISDVFCFVSCAVVMVILCDIFKELYHCRLWHFFAAEDMLFVGFRWNA